nr:hypothetical protein [Pirellulaceae bacterium]
MPDTSQTDRPFRVTSPLGPDKLLFYRMTAHEHLGRLFEFHLEVLSEDPAIALQNIVAQPL